MAFYKYVGNVYRADTTTIIRFRSSDGRQLEMTKGGSAVDITAVDLANLSQLYIFQADVAPEPDPGGGGGTPPSGGGTGLVVVATKAALNAVVGMVAGDIRAVLADETNGGVYMLYGYTGSQWQMLGGPIAGDGVGPSFDIFEDPDTGWPDRPVGYAGGTWIGWTNPTSLMQEGDRFIAIPVPVT